MDVSGGATGAMFPTGNRVDMIDGIAVTRLDVVMPMVIARAEDFGLTGTETAAQLNDNRTFYERMEPLRRKAGALMGTGDVSASVTLKFGLLAPALFHTVELPSLARRHRLPAPRIHSIVPWHS